MTGPRLSRLVMLLALCALPGCGTRTASNAPADQLPGVSPPARMPAPRGDSVLVALGNEPFWNVRVTATEIVYADPEHQDGYRFPAAAPVREGDSDVYRTTRTAADGPQSLELRVRNAPCSDGMSDKQYPMSATLILGGQTHKGCAELRPVAQ